MGAPAVVPVPVGAPPPEDDDEAEPDDDEELLDEDRADEPLDAGGAAGGRARAAPALSRVPP